jgi:hypothetical protein
LNGSSTKPPKKTGNKFTPGTNLGKHGTPDGGLNDFQQSVHDTIAKVTGAFKGGGTTAGADTTPTNGEADSDPAPDK